MRFVNLNDLWVVYSLCQNSSRCTRTQRGYVLYMGFLLDLIVLLYLFFISLLQVVSCNSDNTKGFQSVTGRMDHGRVKLAWNGLVNAKSRCHGSSLETNYEGKQKGSWDMVLECPHTMRMSGIQVRQHNHYRKIDNFRIQCASYN